MGTRLRTVIGRICLFGVVNITSLNSCPNAVREGVAVFVDPWKYESSLGVHS